jgi:chromosome segregation ATPase
MRAERNALKNQLETTHSELNAANDQLRGLRTTVAQLETRNGGLSITVTELEGGLKTALSELTETKTQLAAINEKRDILAGEAASAEERAQNLEHQL